MPEADNRFFSMLCLPFNDPEAALRHVETFGDRKHVGGFMVTTVRSHMAVYDNANKKPSDYMRDMFYSSQPMEIQDYGAMECTFRMMNAETQLLYSSDYPHWDFDLPSTIYDLPFLSEKAKHNILGGTAARLFKLPPRNEKQKANLQKFGNLAAAAA